MLQFWKDNYRMILLTVVALITGIVIGLLIGLSVETHEEPAAEAGSTGVTSILPGAVIEKYIRFDGCGHTLSVPQESRAFIGYTEEELAAFYDAGTIDAFSSTYAAISFVQAGFCPNHYVLGSVDGLLCVYRTSAETLARDIVQVIQTVNPQEFPEEERALLGTGIAFDSLEQIDTYLENVES